MPATKRARRSGRLGVNEIEELQQPADIDHNHIRHEALEARSFSIDHEAQKDKCLACNTCRKNRGPTHFFDHIIIHASKRRFRCSKCGDTKYKPAAFKKHRIKCGGETIDDIDSEMIEEWRQLINKCYPQHSEEMHDYLNQKFARILAPKTPKNTKPKKKREEQREGSLQKCLEPFVYPTDGSNGMNHMETTESTAIPAESVENSMPQLSLLRQDVIKDEDWNQGTESPSNASSTSTSVEQNSQLVLILQKRNEEIRLLREELETWNRKMVQMEQMLAGKCMETSQLREEKIASDAQREAQFRALQNKTLDAESSIKN
ncbi:unnamed protein product, partial [Mesorhabditis belari]|uniref:Uncharacterized protein n=1 Tax=Mesorhabditis belari TaxID=2138241 RepID=A0AAF3ERM2_9BILA